MSFWSWWCPERRPTLLDRSCHRRVTWRCSVVGRPAKVSVEWTASTHAHTQSSRTLWLSLIWGQHDESHCKMRLCVFGEMQQLDFYHLCVSFFQLLWLLQTQVLPAGECEELCVIQALHGPETDTALSGAHGIPVYLWCATGKLFVVVNWWPIL